MSVDLNKLFPRAMYKLAEDSRTPRTYNPLEERPTPDAERRVAETRVTTLVGTEGVRVSTVFIGVNQSFDAGPPVLFETMIFKEGEDVYCERYRTWEEAELGHKRAVEHAWQVLWARLRGEDMQWG